MNVKEVMSREIKCVRLVDRLDAAARVMWEQDCGIVPVVDGNQALVGVVTDRDLCMASYTQGRTLAEIPVTAVMARSVATAKPEEPLAAALTTMQQRQVHRLPIVDARNVVVGMLSTNDLVRVAQARPATIDGSVVLKTLAAIAAPRRAAAPAAAKGAVAPTPPAPPAVAPAVAKPPSGAGATTGPVAIPALPADKGAALRAAEKVAAEGAAADKQNKAKANGKGKSKKA